MPIYIVMKKARRTKSKLALQWQEGAKYSPPMIARDVPHTGETKIIRAPIPRQQPPEQQRPAA